MRTSNWIFTVCLFTGSAAAANFGITRFDRDGSLAWVNAFTAGVLTVETALVPTGPWAVQPNVFTSNSVGNARLSVASNSAYVRLLTVDISTNTPRHYTNLLESYGILETVAGRGGSSTDVSHWSNSFEGDWATNVDLSRPHTAFGDPWGNILIVDQRSSSVLKVTPAGRLTTYAGTHIAGDNGDGPAAATNLHLNNPNLAKVSRVRSVNTDFFGNLIIVESNYGYVRRVHFKRMNP